MSRAVFFVCSSHVSEYDVILEELDKVVSLAGWNLLLPEKAVNEDKNGMKVDEKLISFAELVVVDISCKYCPLDDYFELIQSMEKKYVFVFNKQTGVPEKFLTHKEEAVGYASVEELVGLVEGMI